MIIIGENIHILSKVVSEALTKRIKEPLQELAIKQKQAGVDYLDLNVGPVRKDPEILPWLVEVIQEVVDLPLSLDTMNPEAMDMALAVCKNKALINSASGKKESKEKMMPLAVKYNTEIIISVLTDSGIPPDANSRAEAILETVAYANELGIPNENIWVDPIMMPISAAQKEVVECLEFIKILQDVCPGCKSTIGLSNLSNGVPKDLRGILNRTELVMLERYGLYSAIADSFDEELIRLMHGELPKIKELIYKVMDEDFDISSLSEKKEIEYAKTVNVLLGKTLYSHAWLEEV
jgi:cobalamin-dependent methionine synthase I